MHKRILKKIYDGQQEIVKKFGYTLEEIHSNYGYNEQNYKKVNNSLVYGYKEGFNACINFLKGLTEDEFNEIFKAK